MDTQEEVIQQHQTNQVLNGKYRRNRKLQSCEPCRKSKLGCDHHVPCGRCIRRQRVDSCYYHPNPLTRNRPETTVGTNTTATGSSIPKPSNASSETSQSLVQSAEQCPPQALTTSPWHNDSACSASPLDSGHENSSRTHGFQGFTSHDSIMTEDLPKLGVACTDLTQGTLVHKTPISNDRITKGCQILSFFQNKAMIDGAIDMFYDTTESAHAICSKFILRQWLSQLWLAHGDTLSCQNPEKIRQLCEQLCRNTSTSLSFDGTTTARDWVHLATGIHIRWATLAIIAGYVGYFAMVAQLSDPFFKQFNVGRDALLRHTFDVTGECISFCRECDSLDDAFIWALLEYYDIAESTKGHADFSAYCIGAEVNSAIIVMGLHQEIRADGSVPFFLAELRKRLLIMVYSADIGMAALLGRPPRISHRYMKLEPPLDLTDSELFSDDPQELAAAVASLDASGYSRSGKIRLTTWLRAGINFTIRREEILELAFGSYTPEEVRQNADAIQRKTEENWAALPRHLSSLREGIFELGTQTHVDIHFQNIFLRGPQTNILLLHRVLMRNAGTGPEGLIRTAQAILSDVMRMIKHIEVSAVSNNAIHFLVIPGLRSAAILAIELLKQEQLPVYPKEPLLPRSKTIQDLSVFADKLNPTDPELSYAKLCLQGRNVISRILDKILSPPSVTDRHPQTQTQQLDTKASDSSTSPSMYIPESYPMMNDFNYVIDAPIFGPDHDFRQWLESMEGHDWEHPLQF